MVVASPTQVSLYLERTRKALCALRVLCVKTRLQPRSGRRVGLHPERIGDPSSLPSSSFRNLQPFQFSSFSTCPRANSHRIIFFAHPHPLTPIESHLCKKQGEGSPRSICAALFTYRSCRHAGMLATSIFSCVYFLTCGYRGVGEPNRCQKSDDRTNASAPRGSYRPGRKRTRRPLRRYIFTSLHRSSQPKESPNAHQPKMLK
jgi:hypothetical protein